MDAASPDSGAGNRRPYVITLGNEKGGTGKSTTATHLSVALLKSGYAVGCIDLDARQGTLSRYLENRRSFAAAEGITLPTPELRRIARSEAVNRAEAEEEDKAALEHALSDLDGCDFLVIDTPGSDSPLSRFGHSKADTLITPLNDSFLDIDVLALIDRERRQVLSPSIYSQMVWEQNNRRVADGAQPIDWIVMRNRLAHIDARDKRDMSRLLTLLGKRIGFRLAPGFGERVIFRELFTKGLTLLDLPAEQPGRERSRSHAAARREISDLLSAIGLPDEVLAAAVA